jgi:hypothetical protein
MMMNPVHLPNSRMPLKTVLLLFLLAAFTSGFSQTWVRTFDRGTNTWFHDMVETYDKGYLIAGQVDNELYVPPLYSWLIKTDINGNQLWTKSIASSVYHIAFLGLDQTTDGGFILTGATSKLDTNSFDILFMKLNSCGEKEWCNIISTPGNEDYGKRIFQTENGYIALVKYFIYPTKRIWLFKLDNYGNIVWQKLINEDSSSLMGAEPWDLVLASGNRYVVSGYAYDCESGVYKLRPLIIETDSAGNDLWTLPWGHTCGLLGAIGPSTDENQAGFFYTAISHIRPEGDAPCIVKTSPSGQEVNYMDVIPDAKGGGATAINIIGNDSMLVAAGWVDNDTAFSKTGVVKCDTLGIVTNTRILLKNVYNSLERSLITFDNKYLTAGGMGFNPNPFPLKIYLFKLNMNLDYDSVYTVPRTYDSLFPHPVISDTTALDDCGVISDINDPVVHPEKCKMVVFPNPAEGHVSVQLPQYLERQSSNGSATVTTFYRQWRSAMLEVYNLNGRQFYKQEIPRSQSLIELDISSWPRGMYWFRLLYNQQVVAGEKVMVR